MSASLLSRSAPSRDDVHVEGLRWHDSDDEDADQSKCRDFSTLEEAREEFVRALLELTWNHELSANTLRALCFDARTAGAAGTCRDLAAHPDKGHFHRKLDKVFGMHEEDDSCDEIDNTVQVKLSDGRMFAPVPCVHPHECLADEVAHDESQREMLQTMARTHHFCEHLLVHREPLDPRSQKLCTNISRVRKHTRSVCKHCRRFLGIGVNIHGVLCRCGCSLLPLAKRVLEARRLVASSGIRKDTTVLRCGTSALRSGFLEEFADLTCKEQVFSKTAEGAPTGWVHMFQATNVCDRIEKARKARVPKKGWMPLTSDSSAGGTFWRELHASRRASATCILKRCRILFVDSPRGCRVPE